MDGMTDSMDMNLSKLWEMVKDRKHGVLQSMGSQRVRHELENNKHNVHFFNANLLQPLCYTLEI